MGEDGPSCFCGGELHGWAGDWGEASPQSLTRPRIPRALSLQMEPLRGARKAGTNTGNSERVQMFLTTLRDIGEAMPSLYP